METKQIDAHSARTESAQAARYALLRRMAAGMRQHMLGQESQIAPACAHDTHTQAQHAHSRAAVQACIDVVSWLAPEPGSRINVAAGFEECADMLRNHLGYDGFTVHDDAVGATSVSRSALRSLVPAALFALTHDASSQDEVTVHLAPSQTGVRVTFTLASAEAGADVPQWAAARAMDWHEVQALADTEGVRLERAPQAITLTLPAR